MLFYTLRRGNVDQIIYLSADDQPRKQHRWRYDCKTIAQMPPIHSHAHSRQKCKFDVIVLVVDKSAKIIIWSCWIYQFVMLSRLLSMKFFYKMLRLGINTQMFHLMLKCLCCRRRPLSFTFFIELIKSRNSKKDLIKVRVILQVLGISNLKPFLSRAFVNLLSVMVVRCEPLTNESFLQLIKMLWYQILQLCIW